MSYRSDWAATIRGLSKKYGVDPQALLAVASVEGLSGNVGDGGHAFGPFQMNDAGGVLTGRPGNHRAYAESFAGINDAVSSIAKVAKGLHGLDAIKAIVHGYERPADQPGEIKRAFANYGDVSGNGHPMTPGGGDQGGDLMTDSNMKGRLGQLLLARTMAGSQMGGGEGLNVPSPLPLLLAMRSQGRGQGQGNAEISAEGSRSVAVAPYKGKFKFSGDTSGVRPEFLQQVASAAKAAGASSVVITSGYRSAQHNAAVGGVSRSNHITGDALDGYAVINGKQVPLGIALQGVVGRYGLRSGNVPGFYHGGLDPVHVDDGANQ